MLRSIEAYNFAITPKISWRYNLELRACLCWENHWILSNTWGSVYL